MTATGVLFVCDGVTVPARLADDRSLAKKPINCRGPEANLNLRAENLSEAVLSKVTARAADLVHIASYIYAADQEISRGGQTDIYGEKWRRHMVMRIPVTDPAFWSEESVQAKLAGVLSFLTDDRWEFEFGTAPREADQLTLGLEKQAIYGKPDCVVLLSGGADSLCAAVEAAGLRGRKPVIVSHRPSPVLDARQTALVTQLKERFPGWAFPQISFWIHRRGSDASDTSQRSRAFLFACLGAAVAGELSVADVLLADNGVVSLNLPINAQLIGTLASRSTHPKFVSLFNELAEVVLRSGPTVVNPLWSRTRPETLAILKQTGTQPLLQETVSCSRARGRPQVQPQCGYCYQCVDRRFGVIAADLEEHDLSERYGLDVFTRTLPEGEPRTVAESYVRFARQVDKTSPEELFLTFPQLEDCILPDDPEAPRTARSLAELLKRHAASTLEVVANMIGRHKNELAAEQLPPDCLLRLVAGTAQVRPADSAPDINEFRREAKLRVATFAGRTVRLRDAIGLRHIEHLLLRPGQQVHVLELVASERGSAAGSTVGEAAEAGLRVADPRSIGEVIDEPTKAAVLAQLEELRARREDAEGLGDYATIAEIDDNVEQLENYIRGSWAPGGRLRRFEPPEEKKARQAVSKAINGSRDDIMTLHPELGRHLKRFLDVGRFCFYAAEPPVHWVI